MIERASMDEEKRQILQDYLRPFALEDRKILEQELKAHIKRKREF